MATVIIVSKNDELVRRVQTASQANGHTSISASSCDMSVGLLQFIQVSAIFIDERVDTEEAIAQSGQIIRAILQENAPRIFVFNGQLETANRKPDRIDGSTGISSPVEEMLVALALSFVSAVETSSVSLPPSRRQKHRQIDSVTGLATRNYFEQELAACRNPNREKSTKCCALVITPDNRNIRNRYGNHTVDTMLAQVSRIISCSLKSRDFAFRYGQDAIAVYVTETDRSVSAQLARWLESALNALRFGDTKNTVATTFSVGRVKVLDSSETAPISNNAGQVDLPSYQEGPVAPVCTHSWAA